ncbi:hypothetical protein J2128_002068 [Methanomicrobium sp. W14]|nr:hypothetical protein [Methanomicrobium sp. W14]
MAQAQCDAVDHSRAFTTHDILSELNK